MLAAAMMRDALLAGGATNVSMSPPATDALIVAFRANGAPGALAVCPLFDLAALLADGATLAAKLALEERLHAYGARDLVRLGPARRRAARRCRLHRWANRRRRARAGRWRARRGGLPSGRRRAQDGRRGRLHERARRTVAALGALYQPGHWASTSSTPRMCTGCPRTRPP